MFSHSGARGFNDFSHAKIKFDKACGVRDYVLHDLRRTSRTLLSRAGVVADIAEMALGHALGGVRGTYDRHAYESEKRVAFEALAARINQVVNSSGGNVVPLRA